MSEDAEAIEQAVSGRYAAGHDVALCRVEHAASGYMLSGWLTTDRGSVHWIGLHVSGAEDAVERLRSWSDRLLARAAS